MDPHNDVKSDVDYQAVLSHMNIHKGKKNQFIILNIFKFFFSSDKILHNNEASSHLPHTTVHGRTINENDQDGASMRCNYLLLVII
jgi:hypothetical protein